MKLPFIMVSMEGLIPEKLTVTGIQSTGGESRAFGKSIFIKKGPDGKVIENPTFSWALSPAAWIILDRK